GGAGKGWGGGGGFGFGSGEQATSAANATASSASAKRFNDRDPMAAIVRRSGRGYNAPSYRARIGTWRRRRRGLEHLASNGGAGTVRSGRDGQVPTELPQPGW